MFSRIIGRAFRSRQSRLEKQLLRAYADVFRRTGMPWKEARRQARRGIGFCKEAARREGTAGTPRNLGDALIQGAREGRADCLRAVQIARQEGATDADIRRWWNSSDLERRMICWAENLAVRLPMFATARRFGLSDEEATDKVRRMFPLYGDPEDRRYGSGDDRPLPHELRHRIERYRKARSVAELREKLKGHSSYNALVRAEIRNGNL